MKKITFQIIITFVVIIALSTISFSMYKDAIIKKSIEDRKQMCFELGENVNPVLNESIAGDCSCYFDEQVFTEGVSCVCDCAISNVDEFSCESFSGCYVDNSNGACRCRYPITLV